MPKKSSLPRPIKGTWDSFAKSNGLNERQSTVKLELTVVVGAPPSKRKKNKNNKKPRVVVTERYFASLD